MKWEYVGKMTFKEAVKKYGKRLPDYTELKKIPKKVLAQSEDGEAWGIICDKKGKIVGAVVRWLYGLGFSSVNLFSYDVPRGVFIKKEKKTKR